MMPNHHITKPVLIGEIQDDGQFNVVSQTPGLIVAQAWSPYLEGSKDLISDWLPPMSCGNFNVEDRQVRRRRQELRRLPALPCGAGEDALAGQGVAASALLLLFLPSPARAQRTCRRSPRPASRHRACGGSAGHLRRPARGRHPGRPASRQAARRRRPAARTSAREAGTVSAATGQPAEAPGARPVRVNNNVRRALDAALGTVRLLSPDPAQRAAAAEAVFHRATPPPFPRWTAPSRRSGPGDQAHHAARRAPPRSSARPARRPGPAGRHRDAAGARGDMEARSLHAPIPDPSAAVAAAAARGGRGDRLVAALWTVRAGRVLRRVARLGAAAGRCRAGHHLRRDGRHQHGAWRDGDARRLHDVRGAGG